VKLKTINSLLLILIIAIDVYIIAAPLFPTIGYKIQQGNHKAQALTKQINTKPVSNTIVTANSLVVPSMLLNEPVLQGSIKDQYKTLDKGIWLWPKGSTPDNGGNTTLIGHRFTYTNPRGVFYFLNKVKINDQIAVYWNNKEYLYRIYGISEVSATDTAIEDQTAKPQLTLFTCTPLWLPKNRLVVKAELRQVL